MAKDIRGPENLSLPLPAPTPREPDGDAYMPRRVRVGTDPRAALIHYDYRARRWRASNWAGALSVDGFGSYAEAEAAIRKAPEQPKAEKKLAPRKLPDRAHAADLTCRDEHRRVFDSKGRRAGAVLTKGDAFAASTKTASLGLFDTFELAEEAVLAALKPRR
jgi:hypothetical protein